MTSQNTYDGALLWTCHPPGLLLPCFSQILLVTEYSNTTSYNIRTQSVTIHHRNLQVLTTELYKVHHGLAPELMNDILKKRNVTRNFRKNLTIETRNIKSAYYSSETISFLGPKIWELLPSNIKHSENLNIFKSNIKSWKPENCSWRLCKSYIEDIGFTAL